MLNALLTVFLLHWLVLVTPGANVLLVSQLAAAGQRRAAVLAALGVTTVAGLWATLAVFGIDAVFTAFPRVRLAVQVAGGLYLLYVATKLWRTGGAAAGAAALPPGGWAAFRMGFLTNILNPKSALFFGSVFATALPAAPGAALLAAAVGMVLLNALAWHLLLAALFSNGRIRAAYARYRRGMNRICGVLLGAIGTRLLAGSAGELGGR